MAGGGPLRSTAGLMIMRSKGRAIGAVFVLLPRYIIQSTYLMKKPVTLLLLTLLSVLPLHAQTYEQLWKRVEQAAHDDLPQTALALTGRIVHKAAAEGNDAQLLRASLLSGVYGLDLAPDTARRYVAHMEQALASTADPLTAQLWHSVLARYYSQNLYVLGDEGDYAYAALDSLAARHYRASISQPDVLIKARTADWLPLLSEGARSRLFGDDMLHVVLFSYLDHGCVSATERISLLHRFAAMYSRHSRPEAALQLTLDSISARYEGHSVKGMLEDDAWFGELSACIARADSQAVGVEAYARLTDLQGTYSDNAPCAPHNDSLLVAAARRGLGKYSAQPQAALLKNFLLRMEQSTASLTDLPLSAYPQTPLRPTLRTRNVKEVRLRLTPILASAVELRNSNERQLAALARKARAKSRTVTLRSEAPATTYGWQSREVSLDAPQEPGIYYVELLADGKISDHTTLHVSRLSTLIFSPENGQKRLTVVDARSGRPVPAARIVAYTSDGSGGLRQQAAYDCDAQGEALLPATNRPTHLQYAAMTAADKASRLFGLYSHRYYADSREEKTVTRVNLFTDRAVYRPAQQICFSGVAFTGRGDDYEALAGLETEVCLYNVNGRLTDSLLVKSDSLGTFSGRFTLPAACLPGQFRLAVGRRTVYAAKYVKVEEYKRPTFTAETLPVDTAYAPGDTVRISGQARTYAGLPVGGARVKYEVTRTSWLYRSDDAPTPQRGETLTDAEGRFTLPVRLALTENEAQSTRPCRYTYTVSYTVTAENGETAEGEASLPAATRASWLEAEVPSVLLRTPGRAVPSFTAKQTNAAGTTLPTAGTYSLRSAQGEVAAGTFRSGVPFVVDTLRSLPSGHYELFLRTAPSADTLTAHLTLLSVSDTRPTDRQTPVCWYSQLNERGDTAHVLIGTPRRDVRLYFDLLPQWGTAERRVMELSDTLVHFLLPYRPEYGDGATACLALMVDGSLYDYTVQICRPRPDKRLCVKWQTFRSRLTPGQREEWRLRVTRPDGQPARAGVLAVMYDASLDRFAPNRLQLSGISFSRLLPSAQWLLRWPAAASSLYAAAQQKYFSYTPQDLTEWQAGLFGGYTRRLYGRARGYLLGRNRAVLMSTDAATEEVAIAAEADAAPMEVAASKQAMSANKMQKSPAAADAGTSAAAHLRTRFDETAFFLPTLRTGADGTADIVFTLPESTTRWNVTALAHDRRMNYGQVDTTVTASKEFMVEPALPRFLRAGDRTQIAVKVSNLSRHAVKARLQLTLTDAMDEAHAFCRQQTVSLAAGEIRTYAFDYEAGTESGMLVCRAEAEGGTFADGEERYLPVLGDETEVVRTLPFSMTHSGTLTLLTDTLFNQPSATHRRLTVELSSNPTWYAVSALPVLMEGGRRLSAEEWATRYYALCIGKRLADDNPALRRLTEGNGGEADALAKIGSSCLTDLTPWLQTAQREQTRAKALGTLFDEEQAAAGKYTAIDKLRALQQADGSWSWYPGMPGNTWITTDVALLLARAESLSGDESAHTMLRDAFRYLQKETAKDVREMKKAEARTKEKEMPSTMQLHYLYLRTLLGEKPDKDATFLLERAKTLRGELSLYDKALLAVTLARAGYTADAQTSLRSLLEHTVCTEDRGRWFDSPQAVRTRSSYRIPTHCAALEAVAAFGLKEETQQMRLWLLQAKRTQLWETSRTTADAVYALLSPACARPDTATVKALTDTTPLYYTLYNKEEIVGLNAQSDSRTPHTAGYFRQSYTAEEAVSATSVKVTKRTDGLSWGSVSATYTVPSDEVRTEGKGLTLSVVYEVNRDGQWRPLEAEGTVEKGDKVRSVYRLTADADYDFVHVSSPRPACLEPVRPLSGYTYEDGLSTYRALHDASTDFFIEKVAKGSHTFTEAYYADRSGTYRTGAAKAVCVFAPEFCATAAGRTVRVK